MDYSDILSTTALLLSLSIVGLELYRAFQHLHLRVLNINLIDVNNDTHYILVDIAIVNVSSMPKTVYQIDFQPLKGFQIVSIDGVQDFATRLVTFRPCGEDGRAVQVRLEDTASWPLDIEARHSKSVYLALGVSPIAHESPQDLIPKKFGYILALDVHRKCLARVEF